MANDKSFSISIPEFRHLLKVAFILLKEISEIKKEGNDESLLKVKKEELLAIYSAVSNPELVNQVKTKLEKVRKKRERQRKQKALLSDNKKRDEQQRAEQHEKLDGWLNSIEKKDLQIKRENEIKKEADNILGEVKKKISEARHNLERLTALEKLRTARKENSLSKGLFVPSKYETQFIEKVSSLKATMKKQLSIYEDEERALSVMLETEQEGQREEEKSRKMKKLKQFQEAKQADIVQCLFGNADTPSSSDPKFFYWKYYNSGSESLENLLKIRYQWDSFLVLPSCQDGSAIPQKWIVPEAPSSKIWETTLQRKDCNY